ncbi:MAG: translation initiation factor IF-2 [Candidatus Omnitrophota bacterium]|jgi:translation initiation factor IF-2
MTKKKDTKKEKKEESRDLKKSAAVHKKAAVKTPAVKPAKRSIKKKEAPQAGDIALKAPAAVKPARKLVTAARKKAAPAAPAKPGATKPQTAEAVPQHKVVPEHKVAAVTAQVRQPAVKDQVPAEQKKTPAPAPKPAAQAQEESKERELLLEIPIAVKDLAVKMQEKPSVLLKSLMDIRIMATINQLLDEPTVCQLCTKYGFKFVPAPGVEETALGMHSAPDRKELLKPRAPIVTFMGHVDHGKTSLLDAIRKTKVADSEHGGITQHMSAYRVVLNNGEITFIDTPGHEAFTAMRARGAGVTDIVVLVVAADDGVMPQTVEAIDHSRAAGVSIITALNKVDKAQANLDRVKKQLADMNLASEDWGGKTITVPVSAKTGQGIDDLLEMILLEAQMLELKANPGKPGKGIVLEAELSRHRGTVCTLLVREGTLNANDTIIVGRQYGKVKAMFDDHGRNVQSAPPSFPVEILGLSGVPQAGEQFFVVPDEKAARDIALKRQEEERLRQVKVPKRISLEDLHAKIKEGIVKELKLIIKGDTQGSLEAIKDIIVKMAVDEIKMEIMHAGVGNINSSDVVLAAASDALVMGFNVTADDMAKDMAVREGVDLRIYNIIYELGNEIKAALEGMLEPKLKKIFQGRVDVRKVFRLSKGGTIAGCMVVKGRIQRNAAASLLRNGEQVYEGKISSVKRFKDDVKEVNEGFECGISLGEFDAFQEGDVIETYNIERIARKL